PPQPARIHEQRLRSIEQEKQRRSQIEVKETARLRAEHQRETRRPPAGIPPDELRRRHDAEDKVQNDHATRERHVFDAREERVKKAAPPPPSPPAKQQAHPAPAKKEKPPKANDKKGKKK